MQLSVILIISTLCSVISADTTSYDPSDVSSASSRALASDCTVIFDFILDFNSNYNTYVSFMGDNGMALPTSIGNYFAGIQTITEESVLFEAVKTKKFPFSEFKTIITKFTWYSSILSGADATTLWLPEDFLTGTVNNDAQVETSSTLSSGSSHVSSLSSVFTSSSQDSSSTASSSSSSNGATRASFFIPVLSLPLFLISLLL